MTHCAQGCHAAPPARAGMHHASAAEERSPEGDGRRLYPQRALLQEQQRRLHGAPEEGVFGQPRLSGRAPGETGSAGSLGFCVTAQHDYIITWVHAHACNDDIGLNSAAPLAHHESCVIGDVKQVMAPFQPCSRVHSGGVHCLAQYSNQRPAESGACQGRDVHYTERLEHPSL